ncbi:O-acetyl-ADP-ribose deacetylase (regulator of RNase III) [Prauserella sediminis]|uniref:O-acetyl-ADP-ribose deacetylase (Regulator of RNase III) n=1 Tax=Prauserella sediminis TaxID=577680 RepID=A0A839XTE9_9PSEU|nr:macro domain-containing protein [Prauserella sediminis]MBB3663873.1 O-acetyl-ADP-ribose deacetylase (regulator of RNase III) [Prauserella sediminis]
MPSITPVRGDITQQDVDAVVDAANNGMRGGGGVDGAIHRAGGRAVLDDCIQRFPGGLATGDAGWTTAGQLPARWVIHTVGPDLRAGEHDPGLLEACYRRSLEVADELGARAVAFPLVSAGAYGWPLREAALTAAYTVAITRTDVTDVRLVAFDDDAWESMRFAVMCLTPLRILQAVRVLHRRGAQHARIRPGMAPSGVYWRVSVWPEGSPAGFSYSTGDETNVHGTEVTAATSPAEVANVLEAAVPALASRVSGPDYARWYDGMLAAVERTRELPVSFAEYFDSGPGWQIGDQRYPHPPDAA